MHKKYLLGFDVGSSSVKAALVDADTLQTIAISSYPEKEMEIYSFQTGWAEQSPNRWWECICEVSKKLLAKAAINSSDIESIGISYQMHGLVLVDENYELIRPSIIWCDSRAVEIGAQAFSAIGEELCLQHCLNSPGNFTASKLAWVKEHEPEQFAKVHKMMLPGDYLAYKMTGELYTSITGLSEGILWDFKSHAPAKIISEHYGIPASFIPEVVSSVSEQGSLTESAANEMGLRKGIKVGYRAGDQPNNALSLGVLEPGDLAGTGGTSGVIYGIADEAVYDPQSRVNGFAHVNHAREQARIGVLLCINGAGILYSWLKNNIARDTEDFPKMNALAESIHYDPKGLKILPFGNGAERMLGNNDPGAYFANLRFNQHQRPHFYRAALEGIAFSFAHGAAVLKEMGLSINKMKVGNDNLFRAPLFGEIIATLLDTQIEVIDTTGAAGAAKASAVASGRYKVLNETIGKLKTENIIEPSNQKQVIHECYEAWQKILKKIT